MDLQQVFPHQSEEKMDPSYILEFLHTHRLAILSTSRADGTIDAAPIFYVEKDDFDLVFITPIDTQKQINIQWGSAVLLTIVDESSRQSLQIRGSGFHDTQTPLNSILDTLADKLTVESEFSILLPLMKYKDQEKIVMRIHPSEMRMRRYSENGLDEFVFEVAGS